MKTSEQRIADLERRLRIQHGLVVLLLLTAFLPSLAAQFPSALGWAVDTAGRGTFGGVVHLTGATVDILGPSRGSGGLSIVNNDPRDEAFLAQFHRDTKALSISTIYDDYPQTMPHIGASRFVLARYNATFMDADGVQHDDIGMMQCGSHGTVFYPVDAQSSRECPGANSVRVNGDVRVQGRLFVNGKEIQ